MRHILIITGYGPSLINFRLSLIKTLLTKGCKVSVASPINSFSDNLQKQLRDLGVDIHIFTLSNVSINILRDCKSIYQIYKIIKSTKPNFVISYTLKSVIYTGLVLKYFKKIKYFPLITGLGYVFINNDSVRHKILKIAVIFLYRFAFKSVTKTIFQNEDDLALFHELQISKKNLSHVVNGSGVDLNIYPQSNLPLQPIFLMASRLLVDKGVREYVEAATIVRKRFPNSRFQLAGYLVDNPSSIKIDELKSWIRQGDIEYLGKIDFIQPILKSCKFFVLPSYREGTPRSVLEALATGRPVITTNTPGCKETVIHKKNGLLVQVKDPKNLANAMINFLEAKEECLKQMAKESYYIAKTKYEVNKVNKSITNIMKI